MRGPERPRQLTEDFRRRMVAPVDSGRPRAEVMRGHGLGKSAPDRRVQRVRACGSTAAADNRAPGRNRLIGLEREDAGPKTEVDVLRQAAPMFARR